MMRLLTKKQLRELVPYSPTHIARLEKLGLFPQRIKPYGGRNGKAFWLRDEVIVWIKLQVAQRDSSLDASK